MNRKEILELLRELVRNATTSYNPDPEDLSGIHTVYLLDQEQLLKNIETELEKE